MNAPLTKEQIALLMSDNTSVRNTAVKTRPSLLARLRGTVAAWIAHRTVLAELRGLNDRELADIGLNRADLPRVFDPAFAQARDLAVFRAAQV